MFFSKFVSMNDLDESTTIVKQNIVRMICKIDIKRINIFYSNAFYVSKYFLILINFDQLNDFCSMTYKSKMFFVKNQNIITKKRVNNVFFWNCENTWIIISASHLSSIISSNKFSLSSSFLSSSKFSSLFSSSLNHDFQSTTQFWTFNILD